MKSSVVPVVRFLLTYILLASGLTLLVYSAVQQGYRQSANDPQIQMAEDTATALSRGTSAASLMPKDIDISTSLAPFLIVTDDSYHILASSGHLGGQVVLPPTGAFVAARTSLGKDTTRPGENRITWQPTSSVREAAVIVHYNGGYVIAARSLRAGEIRE